MTYKIVTKDTVSALQTEVNNLIADGWVCTGGVSVVDKSKMSDAGGVWITRFEYSQAMVKEDA